MSEQVVEYLFFSKKESLENISKILDETLSSFIIDSKLIITQKNRTLPINFIINRYNNSLHAIFKYKKSSQISLQEVSTFQDFLDKINIELNKKKIKHTTLLNTNSLFLSKKIVPYLHKYEWSIRKLIYLIMPEHFSENWIIESVSKEKQQIIKRKLKGQYSKENLLQEFDLNDFEEYLFSKNYIQITENNEKNSINFTELEHRDFLNLFHEKKISISKPYSLWEEVFNGYINIEIEEIQPDMSKIRSARNIVTHNKEISVSEYKDMLIRLKKYIQYLDIAFSKILNGDIGEEPIDNMVQDLEKAMLNANIMNSQTSIQSNFSSMKAVLKSASIMTKNLDLLKSVQSNFNYKKAVQDSASIMTKNLDLLKSVQSNFNYKKAVQELAPSMTENLLSSKSIQSNFSSMKAVQKLASNTTKNAALLKSIQSNFNSTKAVQESVSNIAKNLNLPNQGHID